MKIKSEIAAVEKKTSWRREHVCMSPSLSQTNTKKFKLTTSTSIAHLHSILISHLCESFYIIILIILLNIVKIIHWN